MATLMRIKHYSYTAPSLKYMESYLLPRYPIYAAHTHTTPPILPQHSQPPVRSRAIPRHKPRLISRFPVTRSTKQGGVRSVGEVCLRQFHRQLQKEVRDL